MSRRTRYRLIACGALLLLFLFLSWVNTRPEWVERYYALPLYPAIGYFLRSLFNWIPFSVGDFVYLGAILFPFVLLIRTVRRLFRKEFRQAWSSLLNLALFAEGALIIFYLFWGMNYFRYDTARRLDLPVESYTLEELRATTEYVLKRANHYRSFLSQDSMQRVGNREIYRGAEQAYRDLGASDPVFRTRNPRIKPGLFTPLINFMGVAGYFNPFTGEAQLNYAMPVHQKPFVACHELAHQAGFGPEDAANFAGFLAATHSQNILFQYSAYYSALESLLRQVARADRELYRELYGKVTPGVRHDMDVEYYYWTYYRGLIDAVSNVFYDNFLKANNQPEGLQTYSEMVRLLIAYYRKEGKI